MNCTTGYPADLRHSIRILVRKNESDLSYTGPLHEIRFVYQRQNDGIPYDIKGRDDRACSRKLSSLGIVQ